MLFIVFIGQLLIAILAAVLGSYVTHLFERKRSKSQLEDVRNSYLLPKRIPLADKRNTMLLIGLGGTGKTSLIKSLLRNEQADPNEKTEKFEIYSGQIVSERTEDRDTQKTRYWFFVADYLGQNLGQLIRSFVVQQKKQYSPFAYSYITSLILVVDLWESKASPTDPDPEPQATPDSARVKKHNLEWNDTALDAIFGLLTEELKYVCLFINKIDLMSDRQTASDLRYREEFSDIEERIRKRCGSAKFEVMLGSAKHGAKVADLSFKLMKFSVD